MMISIDLHVLHYNEEKICPFIIEYWKLLPLNNIYIYMTICLMIIV